jgi:hypothetical protein
MPIFANQTRDQSRRFFVEAWRRHKEGVPLSPLEAQVTGLISEHPEYIPLIESAVALAADFTPEGGQVNPFLHLGLHLALREQVATDRPAGIARLHRRLAGKLGAHEAEHRMGEVLGQQLWEAQRFGRVPDENAYLERLRELL